MISTENHCTLSDLCPLTGASFRPSLLRIVGKETAMENLIIGAVGIVAIVALAWLVVAFLDLESRENDGYPKTPKSKKGD